MKRRLRRWAWRSALGLVLLLGAGWVGIRCIALPNALLETPPESLELVDRHGRTLREAGEQFRREVTYGEIPQVVIHAMLAAEDKRFFSHSGVDWLATGRATWTALREQRARSGASTISQQLIKLSEPRPRTLWTKVVEMATATRMEQLWSKERILATYLNRLDFGNVNYGIAAAARYYFGKPLADLSPAEAALLTGLPWNPSRINPLRNPAGAKARQETVLRRMHANGWLDRDALERALAEPLRYNRRGRDFHAPHFADLVLSAIGREARISGTGEQAGAAALRRQGVLRTSLDLELNQFIERSITDNLSRLRNENVRNAAAVVLDNRSGEVLALVGSQDFFAPGTGMVNGALQPRSAGSTLKPVTYLLAMEQGATPATVVADVPTEFSTPGGPYRPENYHRHCQGPVRFREALACSLNIPAVRVLQQIGGAPVLHARLQAWGIGTLTAAPVEYGLGLTIGNAEVRLLDLAGLYSTLARFGGVRAVRVMEGVSPETHPVPVDATLMWLLADMLADNAARAPAFGTVSALRFDFPAACKTGTSTDFRDNWAVAYTPEFTVAVWVGNFDGTPMREVSGVTGAAPVLNETLRYLRQRHGTTWFERPPGIVERAVHPLTGKLVEKEHPAGVMEKFAVHLLPEHARPEDYDAAGRVRLPAIYAAWAASQDNALRDRVEVSANAGLHLVSPSPGSVFVIDPDVPGSGRVPLVASSAGTLVWESPTLNIREHYGRIFAEGVEGEHRLTVRDVASGERVETWVRLRGL